MKILRFVCLLFLPVALAQANEPYAFPDTINPDGKYVFYSHGFIVEGDNPKPVHSRWGVYDYPAIRLALSSDGYQLIAHHRPKGVEPKAYARQLAGKVRTLIDAGVKPENITLTGFSRGGALTILASDELKNAAVNFAILAGCAGLIKRNPDVRLYGRVLSIYETSDEVGSCQFVKDRSPAITDYRELAISTGKEHGAFYLPRPAWLDPLKHWITNAE